MLDGEEQIHHGSWPPESSQTKALVVSEAAEPPAGSWQPTASPRKVLKGRGTALLFQLQPDDAVRGDKVRKRATSRTVSELILSLLLSKPVVTSIV